ncbi:hypothetical protein H632_c339p2 [Helicosporidium sp. ATCC 50920]|nr:hypothetical protein H632_c339p2 [Helicosporidium sp. ATCC 50920]|eukprot:KDD76142.1 hypothetical protein H632_c339p2 [Helicosporidium sp. ATCC 50920]
MLDSEAGWINLRPLLVGAAAVLATSATAHAEGEAPHPPGHESWSMLSLSRRRRTFFTYERRIRQMSPLHKVYVYFASQQGRHQEWMTAQDMMRSVVAVYPPAGSAFVRCGSLPGEPSLTEEDGRAAVNETEEQLASQRPRGRGWLDAFQRKRAGPPAEVARRERRARRERAAALLSAFDVNGDGRVGFEEWLLFLSLLSVPLEDAGIAFDLVDTDGSGAIEWGEMEALLAAMERRFQAIEKTSLGHEGMEPKAVEMLEPLIERTRMGRDGGRDGGSSHAAPTEAPDNRVFYPKAHGVLLQLFGSSKKKAVHMEDFVLFLESLRGAVATLEFEFYDVEDQGFMTGLDFARSVVGSAHAAVLDAALDSAEALPAELREARLSEEEFYEAQRLWRGMRRLHVALDFQAVTGVGVGREELRVAAERVLGVRLSPLVLDILEHLFRGEDGIDASQLWKTLRRSHHVYALEGMIKDACVPGGCLPIGS